MAFVCDRYIAGQAKRIKARKNSFLFSLELNNYMMRRQMYVNWWRVTFFAFVVLCNQQAKRFICYIRSRTHHKLIIHRTVYVMVNRTPEKQQSLFSNFHGFQELSEKHFNYQSNSLATPRVSMLTKNYICIYEWEKCRYCDEIEKIVYNSETTKARLM